MPTSSSRGARTSARVEILGLTPHALWLSIARREYMLDYRHFPWFRAPAIEDVERVEMRYGHLYWPTLDVDLHIDSLDEPERFPLVASERRRRDTKKAAKRQRTGH